MLSPLRNRFGIPGVISVIALVFAMFGGAYAATDTGDGDKATASAKGKKGPRGPRGKTGKTGPAGPAGPQGPAGAKGDSGAAGSNGSNGKDGADGTDGKDGTSVTSEEFGAAGKEGKCVDVGGSKFTVGATKTYACNGAEGEPGILHPGETLPPGATEVGTFYFRGELKEFQTAPFGWPIPLAPADAAEITEGDIHVVGANGGGTCTGTSKNPAAPAGELCFYKAVGEGNLFTEPFLVVELAHFDPEVSEFPNSGISPSGGLIYSEETKWSTASWVQGSFAVTAPE